MIPFKLALKLPDEEVSAAEVEEVEEAEVDVSSAVVLTSVELASEVSAAVVSAGLAVEVGTTCGAEVYCERETEEAGWTS